MNVSLTYAPESHQDLMPMCTRNWQKKTESLNRGSCIWSSKNWLLKQLDPPCTVLAIDIDGDGLVEVLNQCWNTGDFKMTACEWCSYRCFSIRQRDTNICSFQCTTVICTIATEATTVIKWLKLFYKLMFLIGWHASKHFSTYKYL